MHIYVFPMLQVKKTGPTGVRQLPSTVLKRRPHVTTTRSGPDHLTNSAKNPFAPMVQVTTTKHK
jgi:hypothetical protein